MVNPLIHLICSCSKVPGSKHQMALPDGLLSHANSSFLGLVSVVNRLLRCEFLRLCLRSKQDADNDPSLSLQESVLVLRKQQDVGHAKEALEVCLMVQVWGMQQGQCLQTIPSAHGPSATPNYAGLVMGLLPYQVWLPFLHALSDPDDSEDHICKARLPSRPVALISRCAGSWRHSFGCSGGALVILPSTAEAICSWCVQPHPLPLPQPYLLLAFWQPMLPGVACILCRATCSVVL